MQQEYDHVYELLMATHHEVFAGGYYETAYHILTAALYRAQDIRSEYLLALVEELAQEDRESIDRHHSAHKLSSPSAQARGRTPLYAMLARQAAAQRRLLITQSYRKNQEDREARERTRQAPMSLYLLETSFQEHQPFHTWTDALLAKQVLSGDASAFEVLVQRYNTPLFNFICRFLGDYDLACDVLQKVFLRFYTSLPKLDTGEPFRTWLFHVARNCCVDELRRKHRSALHFSQFERSEEASAEILDIADPGPLPEEVAERRDLQDLLREAILALPPKFRAIVILRYSSQMSFPEIGKILDMPESTAKTYFHRAKGLLRKTLVARLQMESF